MRLVNAENLSVAMDIAQVLGATAWKEGHMEGNGWLVGINATRLFSLLYGRTLNVGRVMSPTLAMIAQREAEIAAFEPVPFYTVELTCGGMVVTGERISGGGQALPPGGRAAGEVRPPCGAGFPAEHRRRTQL